MYLPFAILHHHLAIINYDRVEHAVLCCGNFIGVNGESERYIHMIRDFSLLLAQTYMTKQLLGVNGKP